jgi:exopolysaccharide production protein ExoY
LPTLQFDELTEVDEMPNFSARAAILQRHRTTDAEVRREEVDSGPIARPISHAPGRDFWVSAQADSSLLDSVILEPRAVRSRQRESLKRVFDLMGAAVLGIVFAPLILAMAGLLRREGGPVVFRHRRVGRDGKAFDCLKFRSMVPDADRVLRELLKKHPELRAEWLRDHKLRDDPRITAVGRFLRRTSLDELPQLWNVIRGEMSLVGPRPIVHDELLRYGRCASKYLSARPGVTGLWQVMGRNNTDYRRRVVLDVYYIRRQNLRLDLYILAKTTLVVLGGRGAY